MDASFRHDPINRGTFLRILQQPAGITHAMRLMNQTSVLGRYLWVFRRIVGQMQHDLFHVYTVDQHILMVLRNMRRFFIAEHAHEYPFCSQLAAGWDKPWVLYVAALFHDIAKGRGGDHSELGAVEVRRFCREHGIGKDDTRLIEFLVHEHLTMSRIAQKEDLSNPECHPRLCRARRQRALPDGPVSADRGRHPRHQPEGLECLERQAAGGPVPLHAAHAGRPRARRQRRHRGPQARRLGHAGPACRAVRRPKALWDTLDVGYFMRHDAADIAWHTRQLSRYLSVELAKDAENAGSASHGGIVRSRLSPVGEGLQVLVYTKDQPDLFARICGYFDQAGFSILDAKVHTAANGYALDTFQVVAANMTDHYRDLVNMVETELLRTITESGELPRPSRGRISRRVKSFPIAPRVELRPDEKAQRWLLSVSASDRAGLLYGIARVLAKHKLNLQLAKVTTLGERVEDTFLISGTELQNNKAQIEIETELLDAIAV
jgi:[protein-PII] uridylyltransferase